MVRVALNNLDVEIKADILKKKSMGMGSPVRPLFPVAPFGEFEGNWMVRLKQHILSPEAARHLCYS